jgi:hypothetical protein
MFRSGDRRLGAKPMANRDLCSRTKPAPETMMISMWLRCWRSCSYARAGETRPRQHAALAARRLLHFFPHENKSLATVSPGSRLESKAARAEQWKLK